MHQRNMVEKVLEGILFKSRWLLAPFYVGLVLALVLLLGAFLAELMHFMPQLLDLAHIDPEQVILAVLSPAVFTGPFAVDVSDEEPWRSLRG